MEELAIVSVMFGINLENEMLISYNGLCKLIETGVIENSDYENVNSASIDIVLGNKILVQESGYQVIDMLQKGDKFKKEVIMDSSGYTIQPNQFILAHTKEVFNLPNNISAEYKLKSTMARNGFNHLLAGWCDAGWHGSVLTLEFHNVSDKGITIYPDTKCGQMIFFQHEPVPEDKSYAKRGQYNNDKSVAAGKGIR